MKIVFFAFSFLLSYVPIKKAMETPLSDYSIYNASYEINGTNQIGKQMIGKYFDPTAKVFKEDDLYFLSLTLLDNQALTNLDLSISSLKSGIMEEVDGKKTVYTITLSDEDIEKEISVSGRVDKMGMNVSFSIKMDVSSLEMTSEKIDETIEYPARFVPELRFDSLGDIQTTLNSYYTIPEAKGFFDNRELPVDVSVTSPSGEEVPLSENRIHVRELGDYKLEFKTSTSEYQTNLGNDSFAIKTITLTSNAVSTDLVKVDDINNVLPSGAIVQCQRIDSGSTYEMISSLLVNVSDHYEITGISLMDQNGDELVLEKPIQCLIKTNPNYDRNKVKVALLSDETLEVVSFENYGRYIRFENKKMGTYVVYVEGVKGNVNLLLILIFSILGSVLLVALIVFLFLFLFKKKKKKVIA